MEERVKLLCFQLFSSFLFPFLFQYRLAQNNCIDEKIEFSLFHSQSESGESKMVTSGIILSWKETKLPTILSNHNLHGICNAKELDLFSKEFHRKHCFKGG